MGRVWRYHVRVTSTSEAPPGVRTLGRRNGATIAYCTSAGKSPGVLFAGGFASDMTGTKASALETACRAAGRAYARFDYFGHGASSGRFEDGTIGRWTDDALAVLDAVCEGPQVVVGSSMGGWIMLLAALARPTRVAGLIGLAAAPDFTEDLMWASFGEDARRAIAEEGVWREPSEYGAPLPITRTLIEEGREHLVLRGPIPIGCPVRLIHGAADAEVPWPVSLRLAESLESADVALTLVVDGDHRLSTAADIERMARTLEALCARVG